MAYFSYATSIWNCMSEMVTSAAETIGAYVSTGTETIEHLEQINEAPGQESQEQNQTEIENTKQDVEDTVEEERDEMEDFDIISDHDLYVVMYDCDRGVVTEQNFFIDLEESTRYH